jgi:hypothetical protein
MGLPRERALASIRLSLGFPSTDADIDRALAVIPAAVAQLRAATGRRVSAASELAGAASNPKGGAGYPGAERVRPR